MEKSYLMKSLKILTNQIYKKYTYNMDPNVIKLKNEYKN